MSFPRHREIFPSDGGVSPAANASAHRLDEFPAGYSSAGCSPAWPASASPAGHQYAVMSSCRSSTFHRTANCVLTVCVSRGGKRNLADVRVDFPHADVAGTKTVFNISGNKYRLISVIKYRWQIVYIRHILTHAEYGKGKWI